MTVTTISGLLAAIYARFSHENQRDTSLYDQIRRCRDIALRNSAVVPDELVFTDAAISGKGSETSKRTGYALLLEAWTQRRFKVLVVDEQTRLFRDEEEAARIKNFIKSTGVRVISADGLDTNNPSWELLWGIKAAIGANELSQIAHRVKRGMLGALERGYSAWQPPYGYKRAPEYNEAGDHIGTRWEVEPSQADVVRRIFRERLAGTSYDTIAAGLIADQIPSPSGGLWALTSVVNVLTNRTYAGVITWGGSRITKWRVAHGKREAPETQEFYRPELALVELIDWQSVQPGSRQVSQSGRGGGKHWAAGLVRCHCGTVMTVKYCEKPDAWSVYCSTCAKRKRLGLEADPVYVNADILRALLRTALVMLLTEETVALFRQRLQAKLLGGFDADIRSAKERMAQADKALSRLAKAVALVDDEGAQAGFQAEIVRASETRRLAAAEVARLEAGLAAYSEGDIKRQLSIDPRMLIGRLFDTAPVPALRSVLVRLFPTIVFEGRPQAHKRNALFRVCISPGVASSVLTGTPVLDDGHVCHRFRVLSSSRRLTQPQVLLLGEDGEPLQSTPQMKHCPACGEDKHVDEFAWSNRSRGERAGWCKSCMKAYHQKRYQDLKNAA